METLRLLVIGDPQAKHLRHLSRLPEGTVVMTALLAEDLRSAAAQANAVLITTGRGDVLSQLWAEMPKLRWVHSLAAGVESVLFPELAHSDVPLTNSRGVFKESLGEFVLTAILYFAKDLRRMIRNQDAGRWEQFEVEEIRGQSVGIAGYGEIGQAAARKAHAMEMRVMAVRRRPELSKDDPLLSKVYSMEDRAKMMAEADYVVAAVPLTPGTRGLIGEQEIRAMKPNAVLINIGRGPVVDEVALIAALQEGRIKGAALDVFDEEPLPPSHPFWKMKNVLLSPHTADRTSTWLDEAVEFFLKDCERFQQGESLLNIVDKKAGY